MWQQCAWPLAAVCAASPTAGYSCERGCRPPPPPPNAPLSSARVRVAGGAAVSVPQGALASLGLNNAQSNTLTWRHNSGVDRARRSLRSWGRCNFVVNCVTYKHGEPLLTGLPTMAAACDLAGMKDEVAEEFAETVKK